jgi:hypothetical protein
VIDWIKLLFKFIYHPSFFSAMLISGILPIFLLDFFFSGLCSFRIRSNVDCHALQINLFSSVAFLLCFFLVLSENILPSFHCGQRVQPVHRSDAWFNVMKDSRVSSPASALLMCGAVEVCAADE